VYKPLVSSAPAHSILNAQAFARPAAAVSRIQDERAVSQFETVCVDAIPNETPAKADAAITLFARASDDVRALASGGAAMPVLANVLPMRRAHACRRLHSAGPAAILRFVDPRTSSTDTSARLNTIPRCSPSKPSAIADASVWLECSGELIDVRSVDVLRIREATPGIELIEFVCSRCRTPHASLRFG
jgi:hypothetical protein